jgi:hypothetical protein
VTQVTVAFSTTEYPGDFNLKNSSEGNEPFLLEDEFKGKRDWRLLDPRFLDQAPDGYGTPLHFFSKEAYRFYLPAYLIADMHGLLQKSDPVFSLTSDFTNDRIHQPVNPLRYGNETWGEYGRDRFAIFNRQESEAIVAYLMLISGLTPFRKEEIDQALASYWTPRNSDKP